MIEISEKDFLSGKYDTLILNELSKDNLIIFPSESSYGFAGCARSEKVKKKIHRVKKEDYSKPLGVIAGSSEIVEDLLHIDENGKKLLEQKFSTPLTILFKKKVDLPCTTNKYVGVRIPLNKTALKLCQLHPNPLTSASATICGKPASFSPTEIKKYFKDHDFVFINAGELKTRAPSTCYHFEEDRIIRAGEIPLQEIQKVLK